MRTIPILAIIAAATLAGVWTSRLADRAPPAVPIPEADRDDSSPVSSRTSPLAPRPEERRPLPPEAPALRSLRLDVGYFQPRSVPRADQPPPPPRLGLGELFRQMSRESTFKLPTPSELGERQASLRVDYRLHGTAEQQYRAIERYGEATIEEVRRILQERRFDDAMLEELRNAVQHWLFRGGVATVEQIENEVFRGQSGRMYDAVLKPSRLNAPSPETARDRIVLDGTIEWLPDDVELKFDFRLPRPRPPLVRISFQLGMLVREGGFETARSLVNEHLELGRSRCLELLSDLTVAELTAADGKRRLNKLLRDELTRTLFPGPAWKRVAVVDDILWTKYQLRTARTARKNPPQPR